MEGETPEIKAIYFRNTNEKGEPFGEYRKLTGGTFISCGDNPRWKELGFDSEEEYKSINSLI